MSAATASAVSQELIAAAEGFVKYQMAGNDSSHDWWHVQRVRNTAQRLCCEEGLPAERWPIVDLAALLHDVKVSNQGLIYADIRRHN